jgi:hypothetical protein
MDRKYLDSLPDEIKIKAYWGDSLHGKIAYPPSYPVEIKRDKKKYEAYLTHKDIEKIVKMLKKYEGYEVFSLEKS